MQVYAYASFDGSEPVLLISIGSYKFKTLKNIFPSIITGVYALDLMVNVFDAIF